MKISIDFKKDNEVQVLYRKDAAYINDAILESLGKQADPTTILISTSNCPNKGFINHLTFDVKSLNTESCDLELSKVNL